MLFFTSISLNYLPKAKVLARSVKKYFPDSLFYLLICDELEQHFNLNNDVFDSVFFIKDLSIPINNLKQWIFMHSTVELCTAIKGQAFLKFFQNEDIDKIIYLDPDIVVFDNFNEVSKLLDEYNVILTPHLSQMEENYSAIVDNEMCSLRHGVFNLGFLAVRRSVEGVRFLQWWRDRLLNFCYDDIQNGIFTDQKWIDLAPALFEKIYILRDEVYNAAPWNISHRYIKQKEDSNYYIDNKRLKFYHFSGFDSGAHGEMLKRYGNENKSLFMLAEWYINEQRKEGQDKFGKLQCRYNFFDNGEQVTYNHRIVYRSRKDLIAYFKNPYEIRVDGNDYFSWYKLKR